MTKINLFEFLDSRRGTYSSIAKHMNFKNKGKKSKDRELLNYNSFWTLIDTAKKTGKGPGLDTLHEISKAMTIVLGRKVEVDDLVLK